MLLMKIANRGGLFPEGIAWGIYASAKHLKNVITELAGVERQTAGKPPESITHHLVMSSNFA